MTRHRCSGEFYAHQAGELPPATCDNCGRKFNAEESHREGGEEICPECFVELTDTDNPEQTQLHPHPQFWRSRPDLA